MKLHLPLGLLGALLVAMNATMTANADEKNFQTAVNFSSSSWVKTSETLYKLDLGHSLNGTSAWSLSMSGSASAFFYLGSASNVPTTPGQQDPNFLFEVDPFSNTIKASGMGWPESFGTDEGAAAASGGAFSVQMVNDPFGVLGSEKTKANRVRLQSPDKWTVGSEGTLGAAITWGDSAITALYATGKVRSVELVVMSAEKQVEGLYTVGGAGELGENGLFVGYSVTGQETGKITLNTDAGAEGAQKFKSDGNAKLRFVAAGEETVGAVEDKNFEVKTVGKGGAVTVGGNFYAKGVEVESGATGYSLQVTGDVYFTGGSELKIYEDFTINTTTGKINWGNGDVDILVRRGATLELGASNKGEGSASITLVAADVGDGKGNGVVKIDRADVFGRGAISVYSDVTLDMNHQPVANDITLVSGSLANADKYAGSSVSINCSADPGKSDGYVIKLGGLSADKLNINALEGKGSRVEGIGDGTLNLSGESYTFALTSDFFSFKQDEAGKHYVLGFDGNSGKVKLGDNPVTFGLTDVVLRDFTGACYLWFTNAELDGIPAKAQKMTEWLDQKFDFNGGPGSGVELLVEGTGADKKYGKIKVLISADGIWYASKHGADITRTDLIGSTDEDGNPNWKQVVVDKDMEIAIGSGEDITLHNVRTGDSSVGSGKLTVTNGRTLTLQYDEDDCNFDGNIEIQGNTTLKKAGPATLKVTGNLTSGGLVSVDEGGLILEGSDSKVGQVTMSSSGSMVLDGRLTITGNEETALTTGSLTGNGELALADGANATLSGSVVKDGNQLVVNVGKKASFTTKGDMELGGLESQDQGSLDLGGIITLTGTGQEHVYNGKIGGAGGVTVKGSSTSQTLHSEGNDEVDIKVEEGASLVLVGDGETDPANKLQTAQYGKVTVDGKSVLTVKAQDYGTDYAAGTQLSAKDVQVNGGTLEVLYNLAAVNDDLQGNGVGAAVAAVTAGNTTWEEGSSLVLGTVGDNLFDVDSPKDLEDFVIVAGTIEGLEDGEKVNFSPEGSFLVYWKDIQVTYDEKKGGIVVSATATTDNVFSEVAGGRSNVQAGSDMLWAARKSATMDDPNSSLLQMMVWAAYNLRANPEKVAKVLAAAAGSTAPILGTAQRDALRAQMMRMRDHAGVMGLSGDYSYGELPYTHFWMEATGDFANVQDGGGFEPGYTYNAWGGTVGLELDVDETTSVAAGITALFGDLDGGCADTLDGKLDSYYLSLMGRFSKERWGHTVVGVLGLNQAKLHRTVNYEAGSYKTDGSTSGWTAGILYEATYDIPLNEEKTRVIQPLFGASIMKTSMGGYDETGQNGQGVGLNVGDQSWVTATLAAGARWISAVGGSAFNREAQMELRANIAQDFGDDQGEADVRLQANPKFTRRVRAAKIGQTALQLGASLRVPVSDQALLYFNAGSDIRSGMTAWNLGVGARYDF